MEKIVYKIILVIILTSIQFLQIDAESFSYSVSFNQNDMSITTDTLAGNVYSGIHYSGLANSSLAGAPSLPNAFLSFSVPYDAHDISVSVVNADSCVQSLDYEVMPAQAGGTTDGDSVEVTLPNKIFYTTNYNYIPAGIVNESFYGGENHVITIKVTPVRYDPVDNFIVLYKYVDLKISYTKGGSQYSNMCFLRRDNDALNQIARDELKRIVSNPSAVDANAHPATYELSRRGTLPIYEYCIITRSALARDFKKIVALKRQKGYSSGTVSIESIASCHDFASGEIISSMNDTPGKIRSYLTKSFTDGIGQYVLFGLKDTIGETYRYLSHDKIPTDMYYGDLNSRWSSSSYLNEDYSPELYVGRIPFVNQKEIESYYKKLMTYCFKPGHGDPSYLMRSLYTQEEQMKVADEAGFVARHFSPMFSLSDTTLIQEPDSTCPLPDGRTVINEIRNTGYGFVSFHGHGCPNSILINKKWWPFKNIYALGHQMFYNDSVHPDPVESAFDHLGNQYRPSIAYTISCTTMPYDIYTEHSHNIRYSTKYNLGESFILGEDYGGPAFLGNTRSGYFHTYKNENRSAYLEGVFGEILKMGITSIGKAEALSKMYPASPYLDDDPSTKRNKKIRATHNLLGEPEFEMWTAVPNVFEGIEVTRTNDGIAVSSIPEDSVIVAYCTNDHKQKRTVAYSGSVSFNGISPNSTIMVYKKNFIPYIAPLLLQNITLSNSQYIIASSIKAGNHIDSNRRSGDVVIPDGVEYEIEYTDSVLLDRGFKVEKGAAFSVYPSDY